MLTALSRLAALPLYADSAASAPHFARLAGLMRRAVRGEEPRPVADLGGSESKDTPWEARERITVVDGVAVVPVSGTLAPGLDPVEAWWFGCCRYEFVQAAAAALGERADVHTVVLAIDSPGGYVSGCGETAALFERALAGKLTVAWTAGQCCSAAYWLATSCARIVATPSATVGNIGVLSVWHDYSAMFAELGIKVEVFASGAYKGTGVPGTSLTDPQREFLQAGVDGLAETFRGHVSARRPRVAEGDMQGQWFTGAAAVERGLADATALTLGDLLGEIAVARARRV